MSWLLALPEAGPLGPIAERFCARFLGGPPPPKEAGLVRLADAIDAFAEEGLAADEHAFVEGAGALLGALLIQHFRDARHRERDGQHRIALGRAGFVDPFAVVTTLLSGDERARPLLAKSLGRIEAELAGTGPLARLSLAFEAALAEARPDRAVVDRFGTRLFLDDETEIDLAQALAATEDHPIGGSVPAVAQAAKKLVAMLPGASRLPSLEELAPLLMPRLVGPDFEAPVATIALRGALRVALVARDRDRARFLSALEPERLQTTLDALLLRALDNLARASEGAKVIEDGPLLLLRSGDGLDSARLLLPGLFDTFSARLGAPLLAAVPHRDVLLLARTTDEAALRARAGDDFLRAPHRILSTPYRVDASGLTPL